MFFCQGEVDPSSHAFTCVRQCHQCRVYESIPALPDYIGEPTYPVPALITQVDYTYCDYEDGPFIRLRYRWNFNGDSRCGQWEECNMWCVRLHTTAKYVDSPDERGQVTTHIY